MFVRGREWDVTEEKQFTSARNRLRASPELKIPKSGFESLLRFLLVGGIQARQFAGPLYINHITTRDPACQVRFRRDSVPRFGKIGEISVSLFEITHALVNFFQADAVGVPHRAAAMCGELTGVIVGEESRTFVAHQVLPYKKNFTQYLPITEVATYH
jgi:hypothetical protein